MVKTPLRFIPLIPLIAAGPLACSGDETPTATQSPTATATQPPPTATLEPGQTQAPTTPTAEPTPTRDLPTVAPTRAIAKLSARALLTRASLDLRGVRPTVDEYAQVEGDVDAALTVALSYIEDARFASRVRALYAPVFRTQLDFFPVPAAQYGVDDAAAFYSAVGDEVLQIVSRIAEEDLPYTELVTADWTMANEPLAQAWPLSYEGQGWQVARYTDSRPTAGVLSTNGMWWRYPSDGVNFNRGRANALSRILLCNNYASRPVTFDSSLDLTDPEQVNNALKTNASCVNCHSSLDPLGSYLYGFHYVAKDDAADASPYHPERERMWQTTTGSAPAFFGKPGYTLRDLGHQIAGDPRFVTCAVETVFEGIMDRPSTLSDSDALTLHREAFIKGGLTLKALYRSVVSDPCYRSGACTEDGKVPLKVVSPELLASQVEDLTGYRLTVNGYDLLLLDELGLRSLAGGLDGITGSAPAKGATPTMALVHERLAEGAAWYVAQHDAAGDGPPRLFTEVNFTETPATGRAAMVGQVQQLHLKLFGEVVGAEGPEVEAALALFDDLYQAKPSQVEAWAGVLSVLLRDPEFIFY